MHSLGRRNDQGARIWYINGGVGRGSGAETGRRAAGTNSNSVQTYLGIARSRACVYVCVCVCECVWM